MTLFIVFAPELRHGQRVFRPADRFGPAESAGIPDNHIEALKQQREILPLTRDNYAAARARREDGGHGRGFTPAELVQLGIIDADEAVVQPKAAIGVEGEMEPYGDYFIRTKKAGNFKFFDVLDADNRLLRESSFRNHEKAKEFLDGLKAKAA